MNDIRIFIEKYVKLNDEEWADFKSCLVRHSLDKHEFILTENEKCTFIAFIQSGSFRYFHIKDGVEKVTGLFFSGDVVSDYTSFLTEKGSIHCIQSLSHSTIFKLYKSDLDKLYAHYKDFETLGRRVAENLFLSLDSRLNSFLFMTPEQRYKKLIQKNPNLLQLVPQYMIASYLGVEPESISRIRRRTN